MKTAFIITGLGFGDEGKGTTIDYLAQTGQIDLVVRHNGGAQAAHNVITTDGKHHTFSQLGAGSFIPGIKTHLSLFMMVHPLGLLAEANHLIELGQADILERLTIDQDALVIAPFHIAISRLRELARGDKKIGTVGLGISEVAQDFDKFGNKTLLIGDLKNFAVLHQKLVKIRDQKLAELAKIRKDLPNSPSVNVELGILDDPDAVDYYAQKYFEFAQKIKIINQCEFKNLCDRAKGVGFEGAQGVLLDQNYGYKPYVTRSNTTPQNALQLLAEIGFSGQTTVLGIMRSYMTRHGAGPFDEDPVLTASLPEYHNDTKHPWQGKFRCGQLNFEQLRYAISVSKQVDQLVVTNLDRYPTDLLQIAQELNRPVTIASYGPTTNDKKEI